MNKNISEIINNFETENSHGFNDDELTNLIEDVLELNPKIYDKIIENNKNFLKINNHYIYPKKTIENIILLNTV
jgi:hypothetical protein